jgi:hypothetical protein
MQRIYPNLPVAEYKKLMAIAFWLFSATCLILLAMVVGINTGAISVSIAKVMEQIIGPVCAINVAILFYLGDQDAGAATAAETD